jgi:hypothetical protein
MYAEDFVHAIASLLHAKNQPDGWLRDCLFRDMIISYARPFSGNRAPGIKNHRLKDGRVPVPHRTLHRELISLRNQLIAHTDLPRRNPRVKSPWGSVKHVSYDGPKYEDLYSRLGSIEALFTEMREGLDTDLRRLAGEVHDD